MLRKSETVRLVKTLNGVLLSKYIEDDRWRFESNFFGLSVSPGVLDDIVLLFGARSGLEILRFLRTSSSVRLVVVESNDALCAEIASCLKHLAALEFNRRVTFISSADLIPDAIPGRRIGVVRVDLISFEWATIDRLMSTYEIEHIAGEFCASDIDPMVVYRASRERVGSFYWQVAGESLPVTGNDMRSDYEVSVIVPCYKVLPWIDRCMESLVNQTIQSLEIIAVNDGSPDGTGACLDEWARKYPERIKVIHKANGGCASARNAGLMAARGEYVGFVDADDWVDPRMFEELYRLAILNAADVSQCGYAEVFEESGRIAFNYTAWGGTSANGMSGLVSDPATFLTVRPTIWRRLYKREFLASNEICFPEHLRRFDDTPFQFEVLARVKRMAIIPDCFYFYRQEREHQDIAVRDHRLFVHFPIFDWLHEKVSSWADAEIERYLLKSKINTHLWALSQINKDLFALYYAHVAHDIFDHRVHLGLLEMLVVARFRGLRGISMIIKSFVLSFRKRPEMISCN